MALTTLVLNRSSSLHPLPLPSFLSHLLPVHCTRFSHQDILSSYLRFIDIHLSGFLWFGAASEMGNVAGVLHSFHRSSNKNSSEMDSSSSSPLLSERLEDASKTLMLCTGFRLTFIGYFLAGSWIKYYLRHNSNLLALDATLVNLLKDTSLYLNSTKDDIKFSLVSMSTRTTCSDDLLERSITNNTSSPLTKFLSDPQNLLSLLVTCAYPIFLRSKEFQVWLSQQMDVEDGQECEMCLPNGVEREDNRFSREVNMVEKNWKLSKYAPGAMERTISFANSSYSTKSKASRTNFPHQVRLEEWIQRILNKVFPSHVSKVLNIPGTGYASHLTSFLDQLPIAVNIGRIKPSFFQHRDFSGGRHADSSDCSLPMVYANAASEKLLHRKQSELLFAAAHSLWDQESSEELGKVARYHRALELMQPLEMVVQRKSLVNGHHLVTHLFVAVKPVFNTDLGIYTHVIILHYDLMTSSSTPASNLVQDLPIIEDLLNLLPSILF